MFVTVVHFTDVFITNTRTHAHTHRAKNYTFLTVLVKGVVLHGAFP